MSEEVDERAIEEEVLESGGGADEVQRQLALKKARAVYDVLDEDQKRGSIVIGADTSVVMLTMLSGKTHEVITGVCVKTAAAEEVFTDTTRVRFGDLDKYQTDLIERYINTDEPYDKAGAYGIQQGGALLVETVEGDYFNVVGLPARKLSQVLDTLLM